VPSEPDEAREEPTLQAAAAPAAAPAAAQKVTICHRTNDRTNPYNQINVAEGVIEGHADHRGPVFDGDVDNWGDIIPPTPSDLPFGLNWPDGRRILNNGCEVAPDAGAFPSAFLTNLSCDGLTASETVTVVNDSKASDPATYSIRVNGAVVASAGPLGRGQSATVVLRSDAGGALAGLEDQTITIDVVSGGEVIASRVVTVDCAAPPAGVRIAAELTCPGGSALGSITITNNSLNPVEARATVNGFTPIGPVLDVAPGTTQTGTADVSGFEDQTVVVTLFINGAEAATYTTTPDCVAPRPEGRVRVARLECPPPSVTLTLINAGEPDSTEVFRILVNGRTVQESALVFGGDRTTIVGSLAPYEDQTIRVQVRANNEVLGSRTLHVNCRRDVATGAGSGGASAEGGSAATPASQTTSVGVLPNVGSPVTVALLVLGLALLGVGSLLVVSGQSGGSMPRRSSPTRSPQLWSSRPGGLRRKPGHPVAPSL
jgi:hypothetical protein